MAIRALLPEEPEKDIFRWWGFNYLPGWDLFFVICRFFGCFLTFLVGFFFSLPFLLCFRGLPHIVTFHIVRFWLKWLRVEVRTHGKPVSSGVILANHISYLDILVLMKALGGGIFVAGHRSGKEWFLSLIIRISGRAIAISRQRAGLKKDISALLEKDLSKQNLVLFPEATTHSGRFIRRFRSGLLSILESDYFKSACLQPVTIRYRFINGVAMARCFEPDYYWTGDMPFASHIATWPQLGRLTVDCYFHPPLTMAEVDYNRKKLARHCEAVIANKLACSFCKRDVGNFPENEIRKKFE